MLSRPSPPVLVVLGVTDWCRGSLDGSDPWARVAREERRVCRHYGVTCVSPRAAFEPLVRAHAPGFGASDLAGRRLGEGRRPAAAEPAAAAGGGLDFAGTGGDCLHPSRSRNRRGVQLLTELLLHAFEASRTAWWGHALTLRAGSSAGGLALPPAATTAPPPREQPPSDSPPPRRRRSLALPPSLHAANANTSDAELTSCHVLRAPGNLHRSGRTNALEWRTGACAGTGATAAAEVRRGTAEASRGTAEASPGCASQPLREAVRGSERCPGERATAEEYAAFLASPPAAFFWCPLSLPTERALRKQSSGVVALVAGAMLELLLPPLQGSAAAARTDGGRPPAGCTRRLVGLEHLTS